MASICNKASATPANTERSGVSCCCAILTNIVRMIVQEAMTNCTVTGEMSGRAKLNLDVEGEVVARLECFFEEEEVLTEEEPLVEDD